MRLPGSRTNRVATMGKMQGRRLRIYGFFAAQGQFSAFS
jgi:hypothetical protein